MQLLITVTTTILVFCTIYPPQVLLPFFAERYAVTESQAALLTAITMIPLGIAPLSYGYILESISAVKLLKWSILGLAVTQLLFVMAEMLTNSFALLIVIRFGQGLLLPAAMTSLMTYLSGASEGQRLQRAMSIYVAATIVGGYAGRLLTGLTAEYVGWRYYYFGLTVLLIGNFVALGWLKKEMTVKTGRPNPRIILDTLRGGDYLKIYGVIFCVFFVFSSFLNYLPFRLTALWGHPSESMIGFMYSGYLVGVTISLISPRLVTAFGSAINAIIAGIIGLAITLLVTMTASTWLLFGTLLIFCGSMFLVHSVAVGLVNRLARENKGVVNGLYIAFYYSGGVLGSYLPGLIYERFGWSIFIWTLFTVCSVSLIIALAQKFGWGKSYYQGSRTIPAAHHRE
ncbi:MAG: MFS transporter [Anaerolineaceae bacterium]|nr:MFS transporter [Anaerolineaceae bacterium]MCB9099175.1 MFS transporter [Anaerolineales bacterium]